MDHAWPIVAGMDFKLKLNLVRVLAGQWPPEARDYITECCDQMQKLYQRRNEIAHNIYSGEATKRPPQLSDFQG